jgi:6-phosphogluconate dehydrogenase
VDDETGKDTTASGKGVPCCQWMGEDGAGHFVKMVLDPHKFERIA